MRFGVRRQAALCGSIGVAVFVGAWSLAIPLAHAAKPIFESKLITSQTPGHAVEVDVDLAGAEMLYLVVTDGGNGFACDWADWAEPRLVDKDGKETKLTELKMAQAATGWGAVRVNKNAEGGPLKIAGKPVEYGIGTHANSLIAYKLDGKFAKFQARAGLDNGGTDQGGGGATSVKFLVFTEKPPAELLAASSGGGGGGGDFGKREAIDALDGLDVGEGLEAKLFAAEPTLLSPTNIDIDHLGRVWVCEVVNYRHFANGGNAPRDAGDRILILEDTDGDSQVDKTTVFYQGRDIDSAHGVCVLGTPSGKGTKAIVSAGDSVFIFTDEDGDLKADKKEKLFTGIGGVQHDHGIHAFVFGPDGKLYFNFGNSGGQIKDKNGKPIIDLAGNEVAERRQPYQQGMIFRCNLDGSEFETLAWNFRNNWEVCVDSFAGLWQSDNDDDGNRGVRINFVMEFGNYGYQDEFTGAGWRTPRTGMEAEIQDQHWHLADPGVVPNLLHTGAGSPTGICIYEGRLLPERFHNQVIHCDAGPNVVRAYPVKNDGAGYSAETDDILVGARDKWFRPSDVCVAPDGSLLIADWYDPGVGGHRMGDIERGRIFRVAPPNAKYVVPMQDFSTAEGAIAALKSPNLATRYVAWQALHALGAQAEQPLAEVLNNSDDPRLRARALWLLANIDVCGKEYVERGLADKDANIRITALRAARRTHLDVIPYVKQLLGDSDLHVRRECAIALRHSKSEVAAGLWAELARQYDGQDRWYLEALGLAADKQWDVFLATWLEQAGNDWKNKPGRDLVWRSRAAATPRLLAELIADPSTPAEELPRYLRSFDFQGGDGKQEALIQLAFATTAASASENDQARAALITGEALKRLEGFNVKDNPQHAQALAKVLDRRAGTAEFVALVTKFDLQDRYGDLLKLAQEQPEGELGVAAMRALLGKNQLDLIGKGLSSDKEENAAATARALGNSADARAAELLSPIYRDAERPLEVRRQAIRGVAKTKSGGEELIRLAKSGELAEELREAAAFELHLSLVPEIKQAADELFPSPAGKDEQKLPSIAELVEMPGDVLRGKEVYLKTGTCIKCHQVGSEGKEVGPALTVIGDKLSKQAFFESILYPSAGISHNYATFTAELGDGNIVQGVLRSQTPDSVTLVDKDGLVRTFPRSEITTLAEQKLSLMPADLAKELTAQDLADVVEYLGTLRKGKE